MSKIVNTISLQKAEVNVGVYHIQLNELESVRQMVYLDHNGYHCIDLHEDKREVTVMRLICCSQTHGIFKVIGVPERMNHLWYSEQLKEYQLEAQQMERPKLVEEVAEIRRQLKSAEQTLSVHDYRMEQLDRSIQRR